MKFKHISIQTKLFLLFFISINSLVFSQNKLHFGVQANGNFTTGISTTQNWPAEYYKGIQSMSFCYAVGGVVDYNLTEKWNLQTGLLYRKSGDKSEKIFHDLVPNSGWIYQTENPPREGPYAYKFKYYSLEVPLNVGYALNSNLKINLGASYLFNLKAKSQKYYGLFGNPKAKQIVHLNNYYILLNLGVNYKLNNHFNLGFSSQYFLSEVYAVSFNTIDVPRNYLSLGLNVGYLLN